jgi:phage tail-like protein
MERAVTTPLGLNAAFAGTLLGLGKRLDPYLAHNFVVEIEGLIAGGFSKVEGLESSIETQDYAEGGVNGYVHKILRGRTSPPLVLSHGLTDLDTLWGWYERVGRGVITRKNGTIMLLDSQRLPVMWWNFADALPVKWVGPSFDASADAQVAIERLELVHRGLSRPAASQASSAVRGILSQVK